MSESKRVSEPDDIVTRLRQWSLVSFSYPTSEKLPPDLEEAADEIERLRLLVEAWRSEALTWHHDCCHGKCDCIQVLDNNVREWIETHD